MTRAVIFTLLGAIAAWAFVRDLQRGVSTSDGVWTFSAASNPLGYGAALAGKLLIALFGVAELLFALGLVGDPFVPLDRFMHTIGLAHGA